MDNNNTYTYDLGGLGVRNLHIPCWHERLSQFLSFTKGWSIMADNTHRPPSLDLVSPTSQSPSRLGDEKTPPASGNRWQYPSPFPQWSPYASPDTARPFPPPRSQLIRQPTPIPILPTGTKSISHCSCSSPLQIFRASKPWLPLIFYATTSLGFVTAIAFYRTELFTCMSRHQF